jgi:Bifunctional DNA primase/polymerase, N-terminal
VSVTFNMIQEIDSGLMAINELSLAAAAKAYMDLSIRVFPLEPGGNKNLVRGIGPGHATADPSQNALWWQAMEEANIGIPTGIPGGIIAIDIEGRTGRENLSRLEQQHGELPATASALTTFGSLKLFRSFRSSDQFREPIRRMGLGLRVLGWGQYIIAPPSKLHRYRYLWGSERSIAEPPDWLFWVMCDNL